VRRARLRRFGPQVDPCVRERRVEHRGYAGINVGYLSRAGATCASNADLRSVHGARS
jgi:hypothetical protein